MRPARLSCPANARVMLLPAGPFRFRNQSANGQMARAAGHATYAWCALSSDDAGENRALASNAQEPHPARELLSARRSRLRSMHSSRTTTTGAITRASTISPRPTSTSGAVKPSCWKEKGSNARPSKTVGCFTTNKPRNINHDAPDSLLVHAASCLKISDDGQQRPSGRAFRISLSSAPTTIRSLIVMRIRTRCLYCKG